MLMYYLCYSISRSSNYYPCVPCEIRKITLGLCNLCLVEYLVWVPNLYGRASGSATFYFVAFGFQIDGNRHLTIRKSYVVLKKNNQIIQIYNPHPSPMRAPPLSLSKLPHHLLPFPAEIPTPNPAPRSWFSVHIQAMFTKELPELSQRARRCWFGWDFLSGSSQLQYFLYLVAQNMKKSDFCHLTGRRAIF